MIKVRETPKPSFMYRLEHILKVYEYAGRYYKVVDIGDDKDRMAVKCGGKNTTPKATEITRFDYLDILVKLQDFHKRSNLWRKGQHGKR